MHAAAAAGLFSAVPVFGQGTAGKKLKIGLIGCGGRGTDALGNHRAAAKQLGIDVELWAICDPQKDRAEKTAKENSVPAERCFTGFDG